MQVSLYTEDIHDAASEILYERRVYGVRKGPQKKIGRNIRKVKNSEAVVLPRHTYLRQL